MELLNVNFENLTEDERKQLIALVKKSNKEPKLWRPKDEENYWCINSKGCVIKDKNYLMTADKERFLTNNCFKTKEEAEFHRERILVIAELERFAMMNNNSGKAYRSCEGNYGIKATETYGAIPCFYGSTGEYYNDITFDTEELAQKAIEAIGSYRIEKYYLMMED